MAELVPVRPAQEIIPDALLKTAQENERQKEKQLYDLPECIISPPMYFAGLNIPEEMFP